MKGLVIMFFIFLTIFSWIIFIFIFRKFNRKDFSLSRVVFPLLIFSIIITIDLGMNYLASAIPALNDGIGLHGIWSQLIFDDEHWETTRFYNYYIKSINISFGLLLVYMITMIVSRHKSKTQV